MGEVATATGRVLKILLVAFIALGIACAIIAGGCAILDWLECPSCTSMILFVTV